jgi:hypothetical protein
VDPSFSSSPYPAIGNAGAGYSPEGTLEQYFERSTSAAAQQVVDKYYRRSRLHAGDAGPIKTWERDTRLEGPLMALVVALALLAPFIAVRRLRSIGIVLVVFSIVLVVGPIIVHDYDYRYVIPAFGTLTAGAAIAVHGLWARAAARVRRRHYSERDPSGGTPALG